MQPSLKSAWIARLRSGLDQQGQNYLCRNNEKCCLGVLLFAAEISPIEKLLEPNGDTTYIYDGGASGHLSPKLLCQVGLSRAEQKELIQMNDADLGQTFDEIADWIEDNL